MVDNTIALQVKPLDIATPLMQAAKMRQMESQQQAFEQEQKRDMVGEAAAEIMSAPEHEQQGLWNNKMAQLRAKGAIDDNDHATLTNGYSPLRVQQLVARSLKLKDYLSYDLQRGGMAADKAVGDAAAGVISGRGIPPQGVLPPMSGAPAAGVLGRPPVQPSARVWGDQEAIDAGLYEPQAEGARPGTPPRPSAAPQPAAVPPSSTATSPEMAAVFAKAMTNPKVSEGTRALAKTFLEGYVKNQELTPEGKNYRDYFADEVAGGRTPKSREEYTLSQKRAGATMVNTAEGMDAAQTKARIAIDQGAIKDLAERVTKTGSGIPLLKHVIEISKDTPQGYAGQLAPFAAKLASTLGIPVSEGMSNAEKFQTITRQLVPSVREPGATSNYENQLYQSAVPNASQSHEGRVKVSELLIKMQRRDQDIVNLYRNNVGDPSLINKVQALSEKPIFTPQEEQWLDLQGRASAANQPRPQRQQGQPQQNKTSTGVQWSIGP